MVNEQVVSNRDRELLRLVEQDHAQTGEFIRSVVGTSATIRGWAVTIWLGLLGFAFDRELPGLAVLAVVVVGAFATIDAYHAHLYVQALSHATRLERIVAAFYTALALSEDDPDALGDFHDELESFRPGLYGSFRKMRGAEPAGQRRARTRVFRTAIAAIVLVRGARPRIFFRVLYPVLFLVACGSAVAIWTG